MPRPIQAFIRPQALYHNLQVLRQRCMGAKIWAVIKANAYGHGIESIWSALSAADGLAVLDIEEALRLRQLGWRGPILLLEGAFEARDLEACSTSNLWHVLHRQEQVEWLSAHKTQQAHHVFLKVNTGMNRLGFSSEMARSVYARLSHMPQVQEVSWMTHFSDADAHNGIDQQMLVWHNTTTGLEGECSLANSAAILRYSQADQAPVMADWVRAGIAMYGASPDYPQHSAQDWGLMPVMTLTSRLIAIQKIKKGDTVGYGSCFEAVEDMTIGVVACGYADGYPRHAKGQGENRTVVNIEGVECPLVGRVSMDMLTIDLQPLLSEQPACDLWAAEVLLWGQGKKAYLAAEKVAHSAGTIAYELYCALNKRVPVMVENLLKKD